MSAPNRPPITKVYSRRQQPPGKCSVPKDSLDWIQDQVMNFSSPFVKVNVLALILLLLLSLMTNYHIRHVLFVKSLDFISIPKTIQEALSYFGWRNTIIKEVNALDDNGYAQRYRVDYFDTFSPVAKLNSITLFISMEEVYMKQPSRFVAQMENDEVCRLLKSLYGLKQSPHGLENFVKHLKSLE
ncbi:Cysteine-rich RLK (RECEPTOR-like protein kinase) 8 [Cucumis melo var. makuwa]|uniref:Cysteine-rich RLK (RECEPTOR-like protein kinase) 8 n=1 Tax=Cucumis melo var. makuwa TaxID=1194695 RepID=A0A5D3C3L7_CUCMM|nr:Cysteine-rich RLK (RECEPTOR-like protein kinase) 8 [Cucumis melo var. makuwa]